MCSVVLFFALVSSPLTSHNFLVWWIKYNNLSIYISQLIRYARDYSSYGDFIDSGRLLTKKLVDQGYTLEKLKIYFRKFYGRYSDLVQHYNTYISQFLCDLFLCWCVLHIPDLTPPGMTGYTLYSTAGECSQQVLFTLPGHLFT